MTLYFIANYKIKELPSSTLEECVKYCADKPVLGLDIETSVNEELRKYQNKHFKGGLDPYLSNIVLLQIGDLDKQFVIDVRDFSKEELKPLTDLIHWNENTIFVGQNLKFESKHLLHKYGILLNKVYDTMICESILYNGEGVRLDLASLAVRYLGKQKADSFNLFNVREELEVTDDEELLLSEDAEDKYVSPMELAVDAIIDKSTRLEFVNIADKKVTFNQVQYAGNDIVDPILIRSLQMKGRTLRGGEVYAPLRSYDLENAFVPLLGEMELFGMELNREQWSELAKVNEQHQLRLHKILNEYVIKNHPKFSTQLDLFTNEVQCNVQWTSSKQVVAFFRYLKICPQAFSKQTKRVEWTVSAKDIVKQLPLDYVSSYQKMRECKEIVDLNDFQLIYLIFKKYEQLSTTFGEDWLKHVHPITGKIHTSFVQMVNTGRMASRAPNLQNLPNAVTGHRGCFSLAKDSSEWLLNADFSNQEVRVMADRTNEESMLAFFNNGHDYFGDDLHSFTATNIERTKYNDDTLIVEPKELPIGGKNPKFLADDDLKRGKSKAITFGLAFGKGAKSFSEDLRVSEDEAEEFMNDYYKAYPALQVWFKSQHIFVEEKGFIIMDPVTDFRYFSPYHRQIISDYEDLMDELGYAYTQLPTYKKRIARTELFKEQPLFKEKWLNYWRVLGGLKRKSQNFPIQSQASRITKSSCLYLRRKLVEKGVYIKYVNFTNVVHDEIITHYQENDILAKEEVGAILEDSMKKGGAIFNKRVIHIGKAEIIKEWAH